MIKVVLIAERVWIYGNIKRNKPEQWKEHREENRAEAMEIEPMETIIICRKYVSDYGWFCGLFE